MKKSLLLAGLLASGVAAYGATTNVGPWVPMFQGVDLAVGSWNSGSSNQQVRCLRIDLTDPDIELLTSPRCTNCGSFEVTVENTSYFLEKHGAQVAVNGSFYASSTGPTDEPLGTPENLQGLAISQGTVVSSNLTGYLSVMLFGTNNQPFFLPNNSPATNTAGIFTAIAGNRILLLNGVNQQTPTPSDLDPRTAIGLSGDRRYLYLQTLDGRQPGWSDGADFYTTGEWLKRFGAWDGINVDGGGSTTMVMANCVGSAIRLNRPSFVAAYGRERNIGQSFGVYAKPLASDLQNLNVEPSSTTAVITWETALPATAQVQYGLTTNYGSATTLDARLLRRHATTLSRLTAGTNYYFRAISSAGGQQWTQACQFSTVLSLMSTQVFALTNVWRYTTNNLDAVAWKAPGYNDTNWMGSGRGLLYVLESSQSVAPRNTQMPPFSGATIPRTYYFRTHFNFAGSTSGASLVFSNYVDDGAVFHLNGTEIHRLRMALAPTVINYATPANGVPGVPPQTGDAVTNAPDVFTISGNLLTNLVQGDNVLGVEVHNNTGTDLVFGSALIANTAATEKPPINVWVEGNDATIFWNGAGFTLQQTSTLGIPSSWTNAPGPVTQSPARVTNLSTMFYRLKK